MGPLDAPQVPVSDMKTNVTSLILAAKEWCNATASQIQRLGPTRDNEQRFRCNICGRNAKAKKLALGRELPSCSCGSSVRLRALVHHLTRELFGASLAIPEIPKRSDIIGIDMSGARLYADRLARRLGYTNTFLHKAPYLDITAPGEEWLSRCDFVISSDVFEHVAAPVAIAFDNVLRLLRPGGLFVLTVPWTKGGVTVEHFPQLTGQHIERREQGAVLVGRGQDGLVREYDNLIFHGGEGETLEMRVFSQDGLLQELSRAGFTDIRIHAEPWAEFGIVWEHPWSLPITARRPATAEQRV